MIHKGYCRSCLGFLSPCSQNTLSYGEVLHSG